MSRWFKKFVFIQTALSVSSNFGRLFQSSKEFVPKEIVRDQKGVRKDLISSDFEHGFGPYSFMPGLNGTAYFEIETDESGNKFLKWDAHRLGRTYADWDEKEWDEEEETFIAGEGIDFSTLYSHEAKVNNDWWRRFCISMRLMPLYRDSQMNITMIWRKPKLEEEFIREIMYIYTDGEDCTDEVVSEKRNHCLQNRQWTEVNHMIYRPPATEVLLEFQVFKKSVFGIDDIKFTDCSKVDPTTAPTTTSPTAPIDPTTTNDFTTTSSPGLNNDVEVPVFLKSRALSYVRKLRKLRMTTEKINVESDKFSVPATFRFRDETTTEPEARQTEPVTESLKPPTTTLSPTTSEPESATLQLWDDRSLSAHTVKNLYEPTEPSSSSKLKSNVFQTCIILLFFLFL